MKPLSSCLVALFYFSNLSLALEFSIHGKRNPHPNLIWSEPSASSLVRRGGNIEPLTNTADVSYYANLTLNGDSFYCLIDTGSSDLWVAGSVSNANDTGKTTGVTYAIDSVEGKIKTADLEFAGYEIKNQAYIEVTPDNTNPSGKGLIGLGPNSGSNVYKTLNSDTGRAVVNRIFLQNTSTPNFITVNLGRIEDPDDPFPGNITVGAVLSGLDSISSQPKLEVTEVSVQREGDQHFQILIDSDGIIGPDNNSVSITSTVDDTSNSKQATAVVDTGFSLSQVPKIVADAFYSRFDGAEYVNVNGIGNTWIVPCDIEVNITWKIGGVRYPIHPLDATLKPSIMGMPDGSVVNSNGDECCIGMFQPVSFDTGSDPTYDIILGMSFLRNVYALFNYGDFIDGSMTNRGDPYMQILSTTDVPSSHLDFVEVRLGGVDTTGDQNLNPPNYSTDDSSSSSKSSSKNSKMKVIFLGLAIAAGVLGLALLLWAFCCRRRASRKGGKVKPNAGWMAYGGYGRVGDPNSNAGPGAYPFQGLSSSGNQGQGQNPSYSYPYANNGEDMRYDPVPTSTTAPSNYAGVGLDRGDAPPYSRYDQSGPGQLYDPPRAYSPNPESGGHGHGHGGYASPWDRR
ncbi:acid protease [Dendrothele bispora CBS 962.96]|uniref:Acid protease n=1 Tax=Dendrothele bispora (strain CBS 962.96) TaxID=1314807 RepID=A0A4V6T5M1_DENBC|nr:acid protease [Dendrothele bispora CBS 962.96]